MSFRGVSREISEWFGRLEGSPRRELFVIASALFGGIIFGLYVPLSARGAFLLAALVAATGCFVVKTRLQLVMLIALVVSLLGLAKAELARVELQATVPEKFLNRAFVYEGVVRGYPRRSLKTTSFDLKVDRVDTEAASLKLRVVGALYPEVQIGDRLEVRCTLKKERPESCRVYELKIVVQASGLTGILARLRSFVTDLTASIFPEPQGSLMRGLLFGADADISRDLRDDFRRAGLSHIVAVSGSNVGLITIYVYVFLVAVWLPRKRAVLAVAGALLFFLFFVGFEPALLRAAVMGSLYLISKYLGRPQAMPNIFLATLALLLFLEPELFFNLGFQLSALATFGILFVAPRLEPYAQWIPNIKGLREIVLMTVAAILTTTPLLYAIFGTLSLVGIFSNVLVIPLLTPTIALGLVALGLAVVSPVVGLIVALPVMLLLTIILLLAHIFAALPYAQL